MDQPTKYPSFTTQAQIEQENQVRRRAIGEILQTRSADAIRALIQCYLDASIGRPTTPPRGTILYILEVDYLVSEQDFDEYMRLVQLRNDAQAIGLGSLPPDQRVIAEYQQRIYAILQRGSDRIRAVVTRAAHWACVPPEMLAAVLQSENGPEASDFRRRGQAVERNLQSIFRTGSTGFGNVKPETLRETDGRVTRYYKRSILGPGVANVGQNRNIETDIFHAAAVLREGLNQAWSVGARSLNQVENAKYEYYPYFGGAISQDAAVRAMGRYNGWGNDALAYGETAFRRMTNQQLYFLEAR